MSTTKPAYISVLTSARGARVGAGARGFRPPAPGPSSGEAVYCGERLVVAEAKALTRAKAYGFSTDYPSSPVFVSVRAGLLDWKDRTSSVPMLMDSYPLGPLFFSSQLRHLSSLFFYF